MRKCAICGREVEYIHIHHCFEGISLRRISDKYGAVIAVCPACHRDIHDHPRKYLWLKEKTQREVMRAQNWTIDDWHKHFGKSYLEEL